MKEKTIYALGFFDGVHLGHQALLQDCKALADRAGCKAGVVTFIGHPDTLVSGVTPRLINTPEDRKKLLLQFHMDAVVELPFDQSLMQMPWRSFLEMLQENYGAVGFVCGVKYIVTWSVDTEQVKLVNNGTTWKVDVDEEALAEHSYKLTATITAEDNTTASVSYDRVVPKFITTHEEYVEADKDATLVIDGIVVAMNGQSAGNKRNHLYLADLEGKGGYYCYELADDPVAAGVQIGMTVRVTTVAAPYKGMPQTKGGTFKIMDETIKTTEVVDITNAFAAGDHLGGYLGLVVTIKGVTIGSQDMSSSSSQYLYVELNGQQTYLRTYVTDFPTTLKAEDKATIDADHAAHRGYTADLTGVLISYSGKAYLIPISATPFTNYVKVEKTPAEKVAAEIDKVTVGSIFYVDTVVDLAQVGQYYDDVTLTWATTDTTGVATIADGKLTLVAPAEKAVVTVTVTVACGDVSDTKTFSIEIVKAVAPTVGTAYKLAANNANGALYFDGTVTSGRFNGTTDATAAVLVYIENGANAGEYLLYFMDGTTKTYIVMDDTSAGAKLVTTAAEASVFEWNATLKTMVVAEDSNNRAMGCGATSTYASFSCYDVSNTYNWVQFVAA